jgi:hypothetical protein
VVLNEAATNGVNVLASDMRGVLGGWNDEGKFAIFCTSVNLELAREQLMGLISELVLVR